MKNGRFENLPPPWPLLLSLLLICYKERGSCKMEGEQHRTKQIKQHTSLPHVMYPLELAISASVGPALRDELSAGIVGAAGARRGPGWNGSHR
jgi:hypothetical protein